MKPVEIEILMRGNLEDGLRKAEGAAGGLERTLGGLKHTLAGAFAVGGVSELARKIIDVRGEVEALQISFETLAGVTKGRELFSEIRKFAVSTPMQMQDLAKGAQTLLGFNIEAEKVMPLLRQIGDISMGDAQKFQSLTLAFAQMSSTGKLMGQDLLQMINAGFNPLTVIAEKTGKRIGQLKEEMAAGKISVEMVADAFATATGEGGKFHGMLEKQSKGLKGALSNLEGAWNDALNEMGEQGEGVLVDVIDLATTAVQHFDKLGTAILTVVTAYGAYKGSLMAVEALQHAVASQKASIEATRVSELESLVAEYRSGLAADASAQASDTSATEANTVAKEGNAAAIQAEVAALEEELRAKLAVAEANYNDATSQAAAASLRAEAAEDAVRKAEEQYQAVLTTGNASAIERAETELNTAAQQANTAARDVQTARKHVAVAATNKEAAATRLSTFQTQVDTVQKNANTAATGLWAAATRMATTAMHGLKAAFMSNPIGMALVAITSMIGVLSMFTSETEEAADSLGRFREKVLQEDQQLRQYIAVLRATEKGTKSWKAAMEGINKTAREYNAAELELNDTVDEQARKLDSLSEAIRRTTAEKALAEAASKAQEDAMEREKEAMERLMEQAQQATYGVWVDNGLTAMQRVEAQSEHIRTITAATWNAISGITMEYSGKITAAFKQSGEAGEQAIAEVVERIEDVLRAAGATDEEIKGFHATLTDYVTASADGFRESSAELERTQAQLKGLARATEEARDRTNTALSDMSYDQLLDKLIETERQINQLNAHLLQPQVGDMSGIYELRNTLVEIRQLMGQTINKGSIADLENRINDLTKRLKESTDPIERNLLNNEIVRLQQSKRQMVSQYSALNSGGGRAGGTHRTGGGRGGAGRTGRTTDPQREKYERERAAQAFKEQQEDQARERKRALKDTEFEVEQAKINIMSEGTERTIRQLRLDLARQKEEIRRGYEDLVTEKIEQARRLFESDPKNKDKVFTYDRNDAAYGLNETERNLYGTMGADGRLSGGALLAAAEHEYEEGKREAYAAEAQAMRAFLKDYGTFQQQKLAIAEDYAAKIAKAQTEGERKRLEAERDASLRQVDVEALRQRVDWGTAFGEMGTLLREQLGPTLDALRKLSRSDEFRQGPLEEQRTVYELIARLEQGMTQWDSDIFKRVSDDMTAYQQAMAGLVDAQEREREVYEDTSAQMSTVRENLDRAITSGDTEAAKKSQQQLDDLVSRQAEASRKVKEAGAAAEEATAALRTSASQARNMFTELESAVTGLTSGTLKGFGQSLMGLDKLFGGSKLTQEAGKIVGKGLQSLLGKDSAASKTLNEAIGSAGMAGEILSALLGIFDLIGQQGISGIITSVQDTILNAVEKLLEDVLKGGFIMKPLENMGNHLRTILNTVTFGGFKSLLKHTGLAGDSDVNLERDLELLTASNEDLKQAIDNLADEMSEARMSDADDLHNQQKENIEKVMAQTREAMSRTGAAYSNGFLGIGGHHSSNHKINQGMSGAEWDAISSLVGRSIRSAGDFWSLSSKEMYEVATKLTAEYTHLKSLADDGYRDAAQYMDEYIGLWKELEEIENAYREKLTGMSFDSLRSSFQTLVKDVKTGSSEVLASVDEMFSDAVLNWLTSEKYNGRLQDWYSGFSEAMADGLDKAEADNLRSVYKQIVDEYTQERDAAYKSAGVNPTESGTTQSGRSGSFETMTQDQGTKLEGLFTSGQRHWASMDELLGRIADHWGDLDDRLRDLIENTGYCRHLAAIAEDIQAMRRDGVKMR